VAGNLEEKPKTHPIQRWNNARAICNRLVLMTDDSDDRPTKNQKSENKTEYVTWHTVVIPHINFKTVARKWIEIKKRYGIECNLHCTEHSKIIGNPAARIREEIHDILSSYGILTYFSSRSKPHIKELIQNQKGKPTFEEITKRWGLRDPKEQSLFWHLHMVDQQLKTDFFRPEGFAFCDKTTRVDRWAREHSWERGAWYWKPHYLDLKYIDHRISFRLSKDPMDEVGQCLDLADYCAWVWQRVTQKIGAREFGEGGPHLTPEEWKARLARSSVIDQEQATLLLQRLNEKRIIFLKPAELYSIQS